MKKTLVIFALSYFTLYSSAQVDSLRGFKSADLGRYERHYSLDSAGNDKLSALFFAFTLQSFTKADGKYVEYFVSGLELDTLLALSKAQKDNYLSRILKTKLRESYKQWRQEKKSKEPLRLRSEQFQDSVGFTRIKTLE